TAAGGALAEAGRVGQPGPRETGLRESRPDPGRGRRGAARDLAPVEAERRRVVAPQPQAVGEESAGARRRIAASDEVAKDRLLAREVALDEEPPGLLEPGLSLEPPRRRAVAAAEQRARREPGDRERRGESPGPERGTAQEPREPAAGARGDRLEPEQRREVRLDAARVLVPVAGALLEALLHDRAQVLREAHAGRPLRVAELDRLEEARRRRLAERGRPGQRLECEEAEREHVRGG